MGIPVPHFMQVDRVVGARQVHGHDVLIADRQPVSESTADILLARDPACAISVRAADCAPLLIADRRRGVVAAAHAGWRGMQQQVAQVAVQALTREYGSRPDDLTAAVGPSIGACCYEVGPDVREAFRTAGFRDRDIDRWFLERPMASERNPSLPMLALERRADKWFFDGWIAMRDQLIDAGVPSDEIFIAELCTASHPNVFASFRREGHKAGRLVAAIRPLQPRPSPH